MPSLVALTTLSLLGYHLTFDAEMSTPGDMSEFINTFANGNTTLYHNNEAENYFPYAPLPAASPYSFANGALVIAAAPTTSGNKPYASGMLETSSLFTQSGGYFEIRAETPAAPGFWPAFWLLPAAYYPEIDILEQPNMEPTHYVYWTHTSTPTNDTGGFMHTNANVTHGYHRYGFLWTATSIQYVFDGTLMGAPQPVPPSLVGLQMYMIANLAVGGPGSWPGPVAAGATSTYSIDYVRAYSNDPTVPAVDQEPVSSPDGVNTLAMLALPAPPVPHAIGTGPDTLVLTLSEDAYQGNAQFTLSIDGQQRGGTLIASASHAGGQVQPFTVRGNFGTANHTVAVNLVNGNSGAGGSRDLYVTGATLNGTLIEGAALSEYASGPQSFGFTGEPVQPVIIGSGPDTFVLDFSTVPALLNAQFTIMVDGVPQGGVQTAAALHAYGQTQPFEVQGTFGPAAHTVTLGFLNGAITAGTAGPAELYADNVSYDGVAVNPGAGAFTAAGNYAIQSPQQQPDTVTLNLTEDSYLGDAQAAVSVDGQLVGTATVTAANAAGQPQVVTYSGNWGGPAISHVVQVAYVNDAYLCSGQDRNLYVQSVVLDNASLAGQQQAMMRQGTASFNYMAPAPDSAGWAPVQTAGAQAASTAPSSR